MVNTSREVKCIPCNLLKQNYTLKLKNNELAMDHIVVMTHNMGPFFIIIFAFSEFFILFYKRVTFVIFTYFIRIYIK
jgi:hypothetical protein